MRVKKRGKRPARPSGRTPALAPVCLAFALGIAAVSVFYKSLGEAEVLFSQWLSSESFLQLIFSCALWYVLVCLAATSTLCLPLVAMAAFFCGGSLAYQTASIISAGAPVIFLQILLRVALPGIILVPSFIFLACAAVPASVGLRAPDSGKRRLASRRMLAASALSFTALVCACSYIHFLLPKFI